MKHTYFITGISTEVGKTIVSAILTELLNADYWKPIQSGDLQLSDSQKVKDLISNKKTIFYPNAYALNTPASPHLAAEIDGVEIQLEKIIRPKTENNLVIEGAGGLYVPVNQADTIADLMLPSDRIIVVSRHYLGSINHTLLTCEALKNRGLNIFGIVFSGENASSEEIILKKTGVKKIGTIAQEPYFDRSVILEYAQHWEISFKEDKS